MKDCVSVEDLHLGQSADAFIQSDSKYIGQKYETYYIAVGTVRMFIEIRSKQSQLLG